MKKLKQRVTLKRRRRNKMRHSHKMQRGGIGLMKKLSNPVAAYQLSRENKEKEGLTANQIIELPENTDINDLIRIADKNLSPKIYRDASDIMIRTKKELAFTDWRNWGKEDTKINKNLMHYFTAYNRIAQILTQQKMKQLTTIKDDDPAKDAKINNSVKPLFDFFCEYIIVIGHILESIQEQQNKYNILKILYDHRNNGTLKDAIKDTQLLSETEGLKNMSLKEGIKKYSINTLKLEVGSTEEKLIRLNDLINKNNEDIAAFNTGIGNAQSIITEIDQGECVISGIAMSIGKSNVIFDASAAPVVASVNSNASLPLVNSAASSASVVPNVASLPVNSNASVPLVVPNALPLVNASDAFLPNVDPNAFGASVVDSNNNSYDNSRSSSFSSVDTNDPELNMRLNKLIDDDLKEIQKLPFIEKKKRLKALGITDEDLPLYLYSNGGKRNKKRKQRGGGKDQIIASLNQFVKAATRQIKAQAEAGVVDNPMDSQTTGTAANPTTNPAANTAGIVPRILHDQSTNVPVFATSPLQGSQPQNIGSLDDIIGRHDAANEKQTALLIAQFEKLAKLIEGRVQGSRGTGEIGIETEQESVVLSRSVDSNEESGEKSKDLSIKLGDLSKLTGDTYVQSVRYLKLLKAIIEKQPDKDGSGDVMTAIDTALELLKALIDEDNGIIKIDETTKGNLEADNADIVEILFSLLGIGVTTATLGGKRKRKCKRCTRKRMKYRRDKKTKKRPRRRP
jgi:hypothetical protein